MQIFLDVWPSQEPGVSVTMPFTMSVTFSLITSFATPRICLTPLCKELNKFSKNVKKNLRMQKMQKNCKYAGKGKKCKKFEKKIEKLKKYK